jgi:CyaY protein
MTDATANDKLDPADYQSRSETLLASIESTVDGWLQTDVIDVDANRTGGLLELGFPNGSKIVINTQPPLQEIWLAARSGGLHFKWIDGRWLDTRERRDFFDALSHAASEQAGATLRFSPPA